MGEDLTVQVVPANQPPLSPLFSEGSHLFNYGDPLLFNILVGDMAQPVFYVPAHSQDHIPPVNALLPAFLAVVLLVIASVLSIRRKSFNYK